MNKKTTLQTLFMLMLMLAITGVSKAQCNEGGPGGGFGNIEIQPDCPPQEVPPEIVGASFSDGWMDVVTTPLTTSDVSPNGFTMYSNANFLINNRVVTEMNPNSPYSLYCPVVQIATVLRYHSRELVQRTEGNWGGGGQPLYSTTASYEIDPNLLIEPFDLMTETHFGCEVPPAPMQPPAPIEPEIIDVGNVGASMLRYDFNRISQARRYVYRHMPGHEFGTCPTTCGNPPDSREEYTVYSYENIYPGDRVRAVIPFGPIIGCAFAGIIIHNASELACFDTNNN